MAIFTNQASLSYNGVTVNSNLATGEIRDALSIDKVVLGDSYATGEEKTYIISIVNSCPTDVTGVTVTDNLGAYEFDGQTVYPLTYSEGTLTMFVNGTVAEAPTVSSVAGLVISELTVPASSNVLLIYSAVVNEFASPLASGEITNTVTLASAEKETLTASETITARNTSLLSVSKSISPETVSECEEMTFTFVMQNMGNTEETGAVLTDTFAVPLTNPVVALDGVVLTEGTDYTYDTATGLFSTVQGVISIPAATFEQNDSGEWVTNPGSSTLTITAAI
ncbi:MAG: hypothetical protein E7515_08275 [Ruminococcaceae bacterium]|nr:hypothetical protein [Oscillospiraceae bacterium]